MLEGESYAGSGCQLVLADSTANVPYEIVAGVWIDAAVTMKHDNSAQGAGDPPEG